MRTNLRGNVRCGPTDKSKREIKTEERLITSQENIHKRKINAPEATIMTLRKELRMQREHVLLCREAIR